MPSLHELQADLAAAIRHGDLAAFDAVIAGDGLLPAARLQIYRNHFRITLADALATTYPATERLLGVGCFGALARRFIAAHPPTAPCLFEYGGGLPAFMAGQPELRSVSYAADLARLEWHLHSACHAPDARPLTSMSFAQLRREEVAGLRLRLHPAWRILRSRWPVLAIWRFCRSPEAEVALHLEPIWTELLIGRDTAGEAILLPITAGPSRLLRGLACGHPLAAAAHAAARAEPAFDLTATLAFCLEAGVLADLPSHPHH
jgi:hypothetical protein